MNCIDGIQDLHIDNLISSQNNNEEQMEYLWKIENFQMCPQRKGDSLKSSEFSVDFMDGSKFLLDLYPRGKSNDETESISCCLECLSDTDYYVNVEISIVNLFGSAFCRLKKDGIMVNKGCKADFVLIADRENLFSNMLSTLPDDILTVRCVIKPSQFGHDDDISALSRDLDMLWNKKIHSDLTICAFGHRFKTHKFILVARAPLLAEHIGFMRCNLAHETWFFNKIPAPVLQALLTYLYTGALEEGLPPVTLNKLYEVAQTYKIDSLKKYLSPVETRIIAWSVIKVHWKFISYTIEDFGKRVAEDDWPIRTFIDLTVCKLIITIRVKKGESKSLIEISLQSKSILTIDNCIFFKCKVLVNKEKPKELCKGEDWLKQENNLNPGFNMTGNLDICFNGAANRFPDALNLTFDFSVSHSEPTARSRPEGITNTLTSPTPSLRHSYQRLCSDLDLMWKNTCLKQTCIANNLPLNFADTSVNFEGGGIPVHGAILAVRSKAFSEMMAENLLKNNVSVDICDLGKETLLHLLRYMYSGKAEVKTFNDIKDLYLAAVKYEISSLAGKCSRTLTNIINVESVYDILLLSDEYGDCEMMNLVVGFIYAHQKEILCSLEWQTLIRKNPQLVDKVSILLEKRTTCM